MKSESITKWRVFNLEALESRCVLAALFPAYVDGEFTLGEASGSAPYGLSNTFLLSSRPSASKTIYLDFDGHHSINNIWGHNIVFPAFDRNGNPNSFSASELLEIQQTFQNVAEDFAPFDVNVTTTDPGSAALIRSNGGDQFYGVRSLQTQATSGFGNGIGGVAYVNSFDNNRDDPVFAFNKGSNNGGMTISHEVGHALGLSHDGLGSQSYHPGTGSGSTGWGPIMGAPFGKNLTQWSNGDYANSTTTQNDLSIISKAANGFTYRPDDHANTTGGATELNSNNPEITWGIVERTTDIDTFALTTSGGSVSINVAPFQLQPNLDIEATLIDSVGAVVTSSNPLDSTNASFTIDVPAGQYFLQVNGVGRVGRYSDYGSLGYYSVAATFPNVTNDGDFNDDGVFDVQDIDLLTTDISNPGGTNPATFDITGDGVVDLNDRNEWLDVAGSANLSSGGPYLLGDANLDGAVDVSDLNILIANNTTSDSRWSHGDFNASGIVDANDFNLWRVFRFQFGSPPRLISPTMVDAVAQRDSPIEEYEDGPFFPLDHDELHHDDSLHEWVTDEVFANRVQLGADGIGSSTKGSRNTVVVDEPLKIKPASIHELSRRPVSAQRDDATDIRKSRSVSRQIVVNRSQLELDWR